MIGIVPAGGKATRIMGLPKMLLPYGGRTLFEILLARMERAAPRQILIAPSAATVGLLFPYFLPHVLAYATRTQTMTEDVLLARCYLEAGESVLFGMPDTYFDDAEAFQKLARILDGGADVAVGVFKTRPQQRHKLGMCRLRYSRIVEVVDKPAQTDLTWAWGVLAWRPAFWEYLRPDDPHVGYGLPRAIQAGLNVRPYPLQGQYWDCGTEAEYFDLVQQSLREKV